MSLMSFRNITLSYNSLPLIEDANFTIEKGERICLIGRNGSGKSTLLKLIQDELDCDKGIIDKSRNLVVSSLPQTVPMHIIGIVAEIIGRSATNHEHEKWNLSHCVAELVEKLNLNANDDFVSLSGGAKRRVLLGCALINEPDILLLDEPTNHLDITSIQWLENFLLNFNKTFVLITHDRYLLKKLATHILEIDNGTLISWRGSYEAFLKYKETALQAEQKTNALFDKRLSEEEKWIRQGIKARRTRNEGRVRALKKMREQQQKRRIRPDNVVLKQGDLERSGTILFKANQVDFSYENKTIIKNFSCIIERGEKIGIVGDNGSGKSTLLNLLLGNLIPRNGTIITGTNIATGYFDQHRLQLDEQKSVLDNVREGSDTVTISGKNQHILSYLQDFLFTPVKAKYLVKSLSGGERNRVLLAKLFLKNCNLLVLDEPTNDLDFETLELLEKYLVQYSGTVLLVSHDRAFLNNVVTNIFAVENNGHIVEYIGGYDDWQHSRPAIPTIKQDDKIIKKKFAITMAEKRELKSLPQKIEKLEAMHSQLENDMCQSDFYRSSPETIASTQEKLINTKNQIDALYARWEYLEKKAN